MGKGKRNRQFHYEDKQANPQKYKDKEKKQKKFKMPKWGVRAIWISLAVILVAVIAFNTIIGTGIFERNRILVESATGEYDLNQQMATFIVWQNLYQQYFYEYYYYSWGIYEDTEGILKTFGSAVDYAVYYASAWTTGALRDGLETLKDYLVELVAGADAGVAAGLTLDDEDMQEAVEMKEWLESVRAGSSYTINYKYGNFLKKFIGNGMTQDDIDNASKLLAMYTKYCNSTKFEMDSTPTDKDLLNYIAKNPSAKYEADYRFYKVFDENIAKEFEKLTSAEDFKNKVFDLSFEAAYKQAILDQFVTPGASKILTALKNLKDKPAELAAKLTEYGIVSASHRSDEKLDSKLAEWVFNTKRVAGDMTVITTSDAAYVVYVFDKPTPDAENAKLISVKAGWVKLTPADYEDVTTGYKEAIRKDVLADKYSGTEKSSEELAKEFLEKFKAGTASLSTNLTEVLVKKPTDSSVANTAPQAIIQELYKDGVTINVGTKLQADDGKGNSYVLEVIVIEGTNYKIKYDTFVDTPYYSIFRSTKTAWKEAYAEKPTTLAHPETTEKGSFQEWLCESELKDATDTAVAERIFDRKAGDIKYFKTVSGSGSTSSTSFTVYIIEKPMEMIKTEDKTVYGGYLMLNTDAAATEMLNALKDKKGFELWHTFNFLSYTSTDKNGKETITDSTMSTAFKKDDIKDESLQKWFFDDTRKADDLTVIAGKDGFYLAYFLSSEQEWIRTAKDGWVANEMTEKLEALVKDGGYEMSETALNEIGKITITLGSDSATEEDSTTEDATEDTTTAEETTTEETTTEETTTEETTTAA